MVLSRQTRKAIKGGFYNSADIWSFGMCKMIIDAVGGAPAGTKKNWRECLNYLADRVSVTPEDLYNKMTPNEFLKKVFRDGVLGRDVYGRFSKPWEQYRELWQRAASERNAGRTRNVELPGKPMNEATRAAKEALQLRMRAILFDYILFILLQFYLFCDSF
jgi:hypothetical protein